MEVIDCVCSRGNAGNVVEVVDCVCSRGNVVEVVDCVCSQGMLWRLLIECVHEGMLGMLWRLLIVCSQGNAGNVVEVVD